ncbi:serine carboxypeptidase-like 17 [Rhodamnia argentea]|uniref:Serine carboxypeptidase-like 17 n=1 Tax=Rhodamnia argentea TaxID=178133 RepID=A0ABM3HDZ4_9MYRT|nr:serine carboxypeptidase-like 17 [Rhodamnia argentea]
MKLWTLHLLALYLLFQSGLSQTVVKSLPGLPGDLPFYLESGYIGVGELEDVQLFYYFVKSERSPKDDPLVLWLTGGPGCSALSGLLYEIGPFTFDYEKSTRDRPILKLNQYSWTKVANIIFLDQPVGTGFSYANSWESYNLNDSVSASDSYEFLRKWLKLHPEFLSNPLYIAGDSYSGVIVPMVTLQVAKGNEAGLKPKMNLEGYLFGNPFTNDDSDINSRVAFAHLKGLISDELYESAGINCNRDYININESNVGCVDDLKVVTECLENIYTANILEPNCMPQAPKSTVVDTWDPSLINQDRSLLLLPTMEAPRAWCRDYNYLCCYIWASERAVQDVLHVREGTFEKWVRCNRSLSYAYTVTEVIDIHKELIKRGYRALIYSGDHDMIVPYVGTLAWIERLNQTISRDWEAWFVDEQVAGFGFDNNLITIVYYAIFLRSNPFHICNRQGSGTHGSRIQAQGMFSDD